MNHNIGSNSPASKLNDEDNIDMLIDEEFKIEDEKHIGSIISP